MLLRLADFQVSSVSTRPVKLAATYVYENTDFLDTPNILQGKCYVYHSSCIFKQNTAPTFVAYDIVACYDV